MAEKNLHICRYTATEGVSLTPRLVFLSITWLDPFMETKWYLGNPYPPRAIPTWLIMFWSLSHSKPGLSCCSASLLTTTSMIFSSDIMETLSWDASSLLCQPVLVLTHTTFCDSSNELCWDRDLCLYELVEQGKQNTSQHGHIHLGSLFCFHLLKISVFSQLLFRRPCSVLVHTHKKFSLKGLKSLHKLFNFPFHSTILQNVSSGVLCVCPAISC